jgi:hypothetical protein
MVGVGFGLRRVGFLGPQDQETLGKLLTHLAIPAVIIKALATATITADLIALPLSALGVVLGLTLIAGPGWSPDRQFCLLRGGGDWLSPDADGHGGGGAESVCAV